MNSPALRKPKNPVQAAAQSIVLSVFGTESHTCFIILSVSAVIGSRGFGLAPLPASSCLIPASTYSRRGPYWPSLVVWGLLRMGCRDPCESGHSVGQIGRTLPSCVSAFVGLRMRQSSITFSHQGGTGAVSQTADKNSDIS